MKFTEIEVQELINAALCANGVLDFVEGKDLRDKSLTMAKMAIEIKREKGTVTQFDMQQKIMR